MRTAEVKFLMREVLDTLPKPYSVHVIDDIFSAIEQDPAWHKRYDAECSVLGKTVVNTWGGYWIANALGKVGEQQVPAKKSTLIKSYSVLDTDAKTVLRKPNDAEARQLMWDYYRVHKTELPTNIQKHRDLIVELLMEGMPAAVAFAMVLKAA